MTEMKAADTYTDWLVEVENVVKNPSLKSATWCGEKTIPHTGLPDTFEIQYCPSNAEFCCDNASEATETEKNHQPWNHRKDGVCYRKDEGPDKRCSTYKDGNHSHNFRWQYRHTNSGACDLRKHKWVQRGMWKTLYMVYAKFKAYNVCMCPFRAHGYRECNTEGGVNAAHRDDSIVKVNDQPVIS